MGGALATLPGVRPAFGAAGPRAYSATLSTVHPPGATVTVTVSEPASMMRDVKLGYGYQRSTGLRHRGGRHRRQCSLLKVLFPFSPNPELSNPTVLVITRLTKSQTSPLHPATVGFRAVSRKAHNGQ
jgi:hypothetical protein